MDLQGCFFFLLCSYCKIINPNDYFISDFFYFKTPDFKKEITLEYNFSKRKSSKMLESKSLTKQ